MDYADIEKGIAALGEKAKKNELAVEDMDGGTFTIRWVVVSEVSLISSLGLHPVDI